MNNLIKVAAAPVQVKPLPVSSLPASLPASSLSAKDVSQITGSELPPAAKTASVKPAEVADRQAVDAHVQAAVAQMNEYIQSTQRDLHFSYDASSGETVVKVLDRATQEVIRQIPDQIFLKLAQNLDRNEPIHFFNAQA